ncbi:hypothetical protein KKJ04_25440, partial [Xenorhabdus bovienii]|uniref:hypothetical protein n=1 Tax=Xenorhabdus bovienii TaxID=40576 RepID=UPI0023B3564E
LEIPAVVDTVEETAPTLKKDVILIPTTTESAPTLSVKEIEIAEQQNITIHNDTKSADNAISATDDSSITAPIERENVEVESTIN